LTSSIALNAQRVIFLSTIAVISVSLGCAEGPLWQTGKFAPWARNQWAEEEKIANTIFTRKNEMNRMVATAKNGTMEQKQMAAENLSETIHRDPILLMRLHGVKLLGELDSPAAIETLTSASKDHNSDVRIAAIQSWSKMPGEVAISQLQEIIGSDTDVDVRLAATRALGNYQGLRAVEALSFALDDPNPALQIRATESLARATGESIGRDVQAWQRYVKQAVPPEAKADAPLGSGTERMVENNRDDSINQ